MSPADHISHTYSIAMLVNFWMPRHALVGTWQRGVEEGLSGCPFRTLENLSLETTVGPPMNRALFDVNLNGYGIRHI